MNTPEVRTQSEPRTAHQGLGKFKEEWEMNTATLTAKVNMWLHEHLAMKAPAKLLGGLALGALVMAATALPLGTTYADEPARPLSSERIQCYPEDNVVCLYNPFPFGSAPTLSVETLPNPTLATGTSVSGIQILPGDAWRFDSPYYDDLLVEAPRESVSATVIHRYDLSPDDEFMSDAPFFHALNEGKVASRSRAVDYSLVDWEEMSVDLAERQAASLSSIDLNEVWPEIDSSTPIHHLMKQLKAGSPPSINGITCYPELDIC